MVFVIALQFYAAMAKFITLCTLAAFLLSLLHAHAASPGDSHTLSTADTAETWRVPNPSLTYKNLQEIETFACNYVDCSSIHSGGPCFNPLNAFIHAAFAMNAYYQEQHQCFGNSGLISITDPSYGNCHFAGREEKVSSSAALNTWCVAKPTATDNLLQLNIDFACSHVNCSVIEPGGECQLQDTMMNHASVAMNLFYQSSGRTDSSCYFNSTGMNVIKDPGSGSCVYNVAVPASLRTKKRKSKASATFIGLMVLCLIIGCVLLAGVVYLILKLRQTPTRAAAVEPPPMYRLQEQTAATLP